MIPYSIHCVKPYFNIYFNTYYNILFNTYTYFNIYYYTYFNTYQYKSSFIFFLIIILIRIEMYIDILLCG